MIIMPRPKIPYSDDDAKTVRLLAKYGVPQEDICAELGICVETLVKLYGADWKEGRAEGNSRIRETLYQMAVDEKNPSCLIFLCKTRLKMHEPTEQEKADAYQREHAAIDAEQENRERAAFMRRIMMEMNSQNFQTMLAELKAEQYRTSIEKELARRPTSDLLKEAEHLKIPRTSWDKSADSDADDGSRYGGCCP